MATKRSADGAPDEADREAKRLRRLGELLAEYGADANLMGSFVDVVIAGDDVDRKKPDPQIYNIAAKRLGVAPENCIVIEDSLVGLRAAKGAGMACAITFTASTESEDFFGEGAEAKLPNLGGVTLVDHPNHHVIAGVSGHCTAGAPAGEASNLKILGWRANGDGLHVFSAWRVSELFMRT